MISAQNHQRQLNGSNVKLCFFSFIIIALSSCGTSKVIKSSQPVPVFDTTKTAVHVPPKMDTVVWRDITDPQKAIQENSDGEIKKDNNREVSKPEAKPSSAFEHKPLSVLKIVALLPFEQQLSDTSQAFISSRFLQYYGGMKLALKEYSKLPGIPVDLKVEDAGSEEKTKMILTSMQSDMPDVIIGPYKFEALKYAAEFVRDKSTTLVSPWISSSSIAVANPRYVQLKAGLGAHYEALNRHARKNYSPDQLILVSRSKEESRAKYFNQNGLDNIREEFITEEQLSLNQELLFEQLFAKTEPTVFILPMISSKDENYIYQFLRRLSAEKIDRKVVVYGTYRWLELRPEIVDYANSMNVRMSLSNFLEDDKGLIKTFKRKYYEQFGEFPGPDAMEGYDLMKFLLKSFNHTDVNTNRSPEALNFYSNYLQTDFSIQPIWNNSNVPAEIDYFENAFIRIVELNNYKCNVVE